MINEAQPFNVGTTLLVRPIGTGDTVPLTVASWRPGIDVHVVNSRKQSATLPWEVAVKALRRVPRLRYRLHQMP